MPTEELEVQVESASISRIQAYSSCAAKAFLRYDLHAKSDLEAHYFFVGKTLHEGIESYYRGESDDVLGGTKSILLEKLHAHGLSEKEIAAALSAGDIEQTILQKFISGEIRKPTGELYSAPRMTTAYKNLAKEMGLWSRQAMLKDVTMPRITYTDDTPALAGVALPEGGISAMLGRIIALARKYDEKLLIPREAFEPGMIFLEEKFTMPVVLPHSGTPFSFHGFMDLFGRLKPEYRQKYAKGKSWVLIDYKTGAAKDEETHASAADESMQLTLYQAAIVRLWNVPEDDLFIALHYVDAQQVADTEREPCDMEILETAAEAYLLMKGNPGIPKRLTYSASDDCKRCELKGACEKVFGYSTKAAAARVAAKEAMAILNAL